MLQTKPLSPGFGLEGSDVDLSTPLSTAKFDDRGSAPTASPTVAISTVPALSHATGRHLRDGSRPSGNSRRTRVSRRVIPGRNSHDPSHAEKAPPTRVLWCTVLASTE